MTADTPDAVKTTAHRTLVSVLILVTLLAILGSMIFREQYRIPKADHTPSSALHSRTAIDLDKEAAKLIPHPPDQPTIFAQAMSVRNAVKEGEFSKAQKEMKSVLRVSKIGPWSFQPFSTFIEAVAAPSDKTFANRLNTWVSADRQSAIARLIRANYYFYLAWQARGRGFAMNRFRAAMNIAERDIRKAVELNPKNPYSWRLALLILRDAEGNAAQNAVFHTAIREFPNYYPLYAIRLDALQPKWYGNISAMYAFVDKYASHVPDDSPRRMLYFRLYADLLYTAYLSCADNDGHAAPRCIQTAMADLSTKQLYAAAYADLNLYDKTDKLQFTQELGGILRQMIRTPGGGRSAGAFLQLAANALGSDTQLVASDTGKNNYMIDQMAALFWYQRGQYADAETLDKRALSDLKNMHFPSVNARDAARAGIYDDLGAVYNRENDYRDVAAYEQAANTLLGGNGATGAYGGIQCAALFNLKLYKAAIHTCRAIIANNGDRQTHFWLARVYDALRKNKAALREYRLIAKSQSSFCGFAATAISLIYDREGKWRDALNALNTYPWLFNKDVESHYGLAVDYNNRCYDKMKLGNLKGALKDCTVSLQYGNLPDAFSKQQRLLRLLRASKSTPAPTNKAASAASDTGM